MDKEVAVHIKENEFASVQLRWMNLEPVVQSEVCQKEKNKYHALTHMYAQTVKNPPAMWETWV